MARRVGVVLVALVVVALFSAPALARLLILGSLSSPDTFLAIRQDGMAPAVASGDRVVCDPTLAPNQGAIVAFWDPLTNERTLVDRVIALGGQTIDISPAGITVDGRVLDERYLTPGQVTRSIAVSMPVTVPGDCVWVMGDNRGNSRDSRSFGPVRLGSVRGVIVSRYWPWGRRGTIATGAP